MKYFLGLLPLLILCGCLHHRVYPYIPSDGIQAYYVHNHTCTLIGTEPGYSNYYHDHHTNQLWSCSDPDTQFWIMADYQQP
jgi:hypothetical protein